MGLGDRRSRAPRDLNTTREDVSNEAKELLNDEGRAGKLALPLLVLTPNSEKRAVLNPATEVGALFDGGLKELLFPTADKVAMVAKA